MSKWDFDHLDEIEEMYENWSSIEKIRRKKPRKSEFGDTVRRDQKNNFHQERQIKNHDPDFETEF